MINELKTQIRKYFVGKKALRARGVRYKFYIV